ncbi:unnamed protein product [Caenorhabditis auriculariae]|uniref:Uncharacterized protein n=1 Tax=Caenorhabditis auriculariae TaxID=2777116 RepID=A0A8S1HHY2_9PELO|nr:unnamed protein product [Caenorhabditis auriculariae]
MALAVVTTSSVLQVEPTAHEDFPADILQFIHFTKFNIRNGTHHRDVVSFLTVYDMYFSGWQVRIGNADDRPFPLANRNRYYGIVFEPSSLPFLHDSPFIRRLSFRLRVVDDARDAVIANSTFVVDSPMQNVADPTFRTPPNSEINNLLARIIASPEFRGKSYQLVTSLEFTCAEYCRERSFERAAPPIPTTVDFRFDCIFDKSQHDLRMYMGGNSNQFETASRRALHLSSPYFRLVLRPNVDVYTEEMGCLESRRTTIAFMMTGFYQPPPFMTPTVAKNIHDLATKYRVHEKIALRQAVERHCCEELRKVNSDLKAVVLWTVAANESDMNRLFQNCLALLCGSLFEEYVLEFSHEAARNAQNADLHTRLNARPGMFRASVHTRVIRSRSMTNNVRCVKKSRMPV